MATALRTMDGSGTEDGWIAVNDDGYRPSADEPFMNSRQLEYFRQKLLAQKDAILRESRGTLSQLQADPLREALRAIDPDDAGFDEIEMDDEGLDPETEQGGRDAATKE